jgi:DNA polymerase I-like protein with 3'-5' exonuclease and polymerase domains
MMSHPECYDRLLALHRAGKPVTRRCWVSSEDVAARADAIKFVDGNPPMALEHLNRQLPPGSENPGPPKRTRRPRLDERAKASQKGYKMALSLAERERKKLETARRREEAKAQRAAERAQAKIDAKREAIELAEGGYCDLPAIVFRNGLVKTVTEQEAWAVLECYLEDLDTDVENSGFPVGHELYELRTVQLGGEECAVVFDAADPRQMEIVSLALTLAKRIWSHSASVEAVAFALAGLIGWDELWDKLYDSVLKAKLNDPKMSGSDADALKELERDLLREYAVSPNAEKAKNELFKVMGCTSKPTPMTPKEKNGWYMVNKRSVVMLRYAGSDVLALGAVRRVLPEPPVHASVIEREREFEAACATVALVGFALDEDHIDKKLAEEIAARKQAKENVEILSDGRITNPKSPDVIKLLPEIIPGLVLPLNRKTKKPSADKGSLEGLCLQYKDDALAFHLFKQILAYRHNDTTITLLLEPLKILCEHGDGRMRPTVYTIEASTGRCSCRRPNGQQFSRQGGIRACVCSGTLTLTKTVQGQWIFAVDGVVVPLLGISADFEGCEIRVGAALSGDRQLYEAEVSPFCWKCERNSFEGDECSCGLKGDGSLAAHQGLHWRTAHSGFGKAATYEHRYQAKRGTFTKLFGGGPDTAAAQVYCDVAVMQKLFDAFAADSPAYEQWTAEMKSWYYEGMAVGRDYATGENWAVPIDGRNRMVYHSYSGRPIYITNGAHAAGNGAIQGTARELLVDGTLKWRKTRWGLLPLLPVHDQILAMVPAEEADRATTVLAQCMQTDVLSSPGFEVHIGADVDRPFKSWPDSS